MKFFVNFLTGLRIIAAFAIIPTIMYGLYWTTFILFILGSISDWFDGYLARKYNVCSKLGGVMDHIGDKLLVTNALIMLCCMISVWFVIIPIIIMIARELYISGLREFLGTQKMEMPVPHNRFSLGKIKTFIQMLTISIFFLILAISTTLTPETPKIIMQVLIILPQIAIFGLWFALTMSIWSATQYTFDFMNKLKKLK